MQLRSLATALTGAVIVLPSALTAQGLPDCLIGNFSGSGEMVIRLVDRNMDGVYDDGTGLGQNEAYDYIRIGYDTTPRDIVPSPWVAGEYYLIDGATAPTPDARILRFSDANGDGVIDSNELVPALTQTFFGESDMETEGMATDGTAIYWISNGGSHEGVWRSVDLNGDGDFEDNVGGVDETTPALVEPSGDPVNGTNALLILNTPNTMAADPLAPVYNPTETQRIVFDPSQQRFLVEEENVDQIIALQDLNADGDFYDPGEVYLFFAPWNGGAQRLFRDAHPDVVAGTLPAAGDVRYMAIDDSTNPATYYAMSAEAGAGYPNIIYRGIDQNADGDINDAGEVNVFFSADPADPVRPFLAFQAMRQHNGDVYVVGDAIVGSGEADMVVQLRDSSGDGVIDNATESLPVFTMPADRGLQVPNFFATGTLTPPPAGLPGTYMYPDAATCLSSAGTTHKLRCGDLTRNFVPLIGSGNVLALNTYDAAPNTPIAMHVGFPFGFPVPLDLGGTCNMTVDPFVAVPGFTTNAAGEVAVSVTTPGSPAFAGVSIYFQTIAVDLGATPFNVTTSNSARVQFGHYTWIPPVTNP